MRTIFKRISLCSLFFIALFACNGSPASTAFGQGGKVSIDGKNLLSITCPNRNQEPCVTAKMMIESAAVIVLGEELGAGDWTFTADAMLSSPEVGQEKFKDGLKLIDAVNYWKSYVASPFSGDGTRTKIVHKAYMEVYGRFPVINENNAWSAKIKEKQSWYTTIVSAEIANLNHDPAIRKETINRAYHVAFGRDASAVDLQYWMPRKEHFRQLLDAQRAWLYSANGAKDLRDTVRRVLYYKTRVEPTQADIDAAIKKFSVNRRIHREMLKEI